MGQRNAGSETNEYLATPATNSEGRSILHGTFVGPCVIDVMWSYGGYFHNSNLEVLEEVSTRYGESPERVRSSLLGSGIQRVSQEYLR